MLFSIVEGPTTRVGTIQRRRKRTPTDYEENHGDFGKRGGDEEYRRYVVIVAEVVLAR